MTPARQTVASDILARLHDLRRYAENEAELLALAGLRNMATERVNDAAWLRKTFRKRGSLNDVMRLSSQIWMGEKSAASFAAT